MLYCGVAPSDAAISSNRRLLGQIKEMQASLHASGEGGDFPFFSLPDPPVVALLPGETGAVMRLLLSALLSPAE